MRIARALSGKHKPTWTPHIDDGDLVSSSTPKKSNSGGKKLDQNSTIATVTIPAD